MSALVCAVLEMLQVEGSILTGAIREFFSSLFCNLINFHSSMLRMLFRLGNTVLDPCSPVFVSIACYC